MAKWVVVIPCDDAEDARKTVAWLKNGFGFDDVYSEERD